MRSLASSQQTPKTVRYLGSDQGENYYYRSIDFDTLTRSLLDPIVREHEFDVKLVLLDLASDT